MIGEYFSTISGAIGEKFAAIINTIAIIVFGIVLAFVVGPTFAAICFAYFPIMLLFLALFARKLKGAMEEKVETTKDLGSIVEESLSAIRLIESFN